MSTSRFLVRKDQLSRTEWEIEPDAPLQAGEIRVHIDRFALTSNNITYAAFGDAMNYWSFFPVTREGWGVIPVWGFGHVVQSLHPGVAVGERLYGYFPMASSVVLTPARLSPASFSDGAPHRAALHAVYNQYMRCAADPFYTASTEDAQALLRPLFITSWLIDDFLADNAFFGAGADGSQPAVMLLSSASSKTAWGTAFQLAQRPGIQVVGLTSAVNVDFCQSLGCYHRVLRYDQLDQLDATLPCIYIDFAGNAGLRQAIIPGSPTSPTAAPLAVPMWINWVERKICRDPKRRCFLHRHKSGSGKPIGAHKSLARVWCRRGSGSWPASPIRLIRGWSRGAMLALRPWHRSTRRC